jgi:hypothetical protein
MLRTITASLLAAVGFGVSAQSTDPASVMSKLRSRALSTKPSDIGLSEQAFANKPWGILMETGLKRGAAYSLVVFADGSTSLYFSTGGGIIGAGTHSEVKAAAAKMLDVAARLQELASPSASTPLPAEGKVTFYFLTAKGKLAFSSTEESLVHKMEPMSELFYAGQDVISAVRLIEEAKSRKGS